MSDNKKRCPILDGIGLSTTYQALRTCGMNCPNRAPSPAVRELVRETTRLITYYSHEERRPEANAKINDAIAAIAAVEREGKLKT